MTSQDAIAPKFFTALGIVILMGLGFWQVERLKWKTDIIEKLHAQRAVPIMELIVGRAQKDAINYEQVSFSGTYDFVNEMLLTPRSLDGKTGFHVITPLQLEGSKLVILVNRGWVDSKENNSQEANVKDALGVARVDNDKNSFTPENKIDHKLLYYVDISEISSYLKQFPQYKDKQFIDYYVVYKNPMHVGKPVPYNMIANISNNHLGYAIIWFSLAAALLLLYVYRDKASPSPTHKN